MSKKRFERIDGLQKLLDDEEKLKEFVADMNQLGREIEEKKKIEEPTVNQTV